MGTPSGYAPVAPDLHLSLLLSDQVGLSFLTVSILRECGKVLCS